MVEELAGFGAAVHTCSRKEAELHKCLKEWEAKGFLVTGSVCDASSKTEREKLVQQVASSFNGKLNILVSNRLFILCSGCLYKCHKEENFLMFHSPSRNVLWL